MNCLVSTTSPFSVQTHRLRHRRKLDSKERGGEQTAQSDTNARMPASADVEWIGVQRTLLPHAADLISSSKARLAFASYHTSTMTESAPQQPRPETHGSRTLTVNPTSGSPNASATESASDSREGTPSSVGVLRLRGGPVRRNHVAWSSETIDNEGMGKKKSKSEPDPWSGC